MGGRAGRLGLGHVFNAGRGDPFSLHAGPLQPPPWPPCKLPADEGSRTPPVSSLADVGMDETATPTLRMRAATPLADILLNLTFMGHLPKFAGRAVRAHFLYCNAGPDRAGELALKRRRPSRSLNRRVIGPIVPRICRMVGPTDLSRPTLSRRATCLFRGLGAHQSDDLFRTIIDDREGRAEGRSEKIICS